MLRILIDQHFDHDILRGIVRRLPKLDYATAFESGLSELEDKKLLLWASHNKRILLTHDRKTMPRHFVELLEQGKSLPGVFVVPRSMPIGQAIGELEIMITCSEPDEWQNLIKILPL